MTDYSIRATFYNPDKVLDLVVLWDKLVHLPFKYVDQDPHIGKYVHGSWDDDEHFVTFEFSVDRHEVPSLCSYLKCSSEYPVKFYRVSSDIDLESLCSEWLAATALLKVNDGHLYFNLMDFSVVWVSEEIEYFYIGIRKRMSDVMTDMDNDSISASDAKDRIDGILRDVQSFVQSEIHDRLIIFGQ